ncbi:hypothetical protein Q1M63_15775 (plasmid) [Sinorhizobium meliloti]|nr:hypothetical protein Q1M63_15775 [Sinorhizobium meliloti]
MPVRPVCPCPPPGRDLAAPALWNFWPDIRFAIISDERYVRDSDTLARSLDMGLDPRIADNLDLDMSFSLEDGSLDIARPKASVNFAHLKSDGYGLSGNIFNFPVSVSLPREATITAPRKCRRESAGTSPAGWATVSWFRGAWRSPSSSGRTKGRS